ncbi:thiamine-phosphate kinase [uncultured Dietzia sp.]|uniref:thiamine-phosphate kinase n=1 Tax=uncultured Dietzia sp. TaxID=395519 RepID=UPI0025CC9021|nr:thiamine-phosphate kinase [uncultured Dietzia sp.]
MTDRAVTVAEAGEAAVLEVLSGAPVQVGDDPVGNGDDAAVLGPAWATVVTTDMLVEGTHFRRDLTGWRDLGRRAVAQNVSDVLAMGAECTRILVALAVPGRTTMREISDLADGIHSEASRSGAVVVGGDLTSADFVVVGVTAIGTLPHGAAPVRIDGAVPGDRIGLTGLPGRSAAGLALLLAGHPDGPLARAYRVPCTPVGTGTAARVTGASSLTDVSDGLLRDLSGLTRASGVAADLDRAALPVDPELFAAAESLGAADVDARVLDWMLDGGEDHGLLGTFPPGCAVPDEFTIIGTIRAGEPGEVTIDGTARTPGGWDSARGAN